MHFFYCLGHCEFFLLQSSYIYVLSYLVFNLFELKLCMGLCMCLSYCCISNFSSQYHDTIFSPSFFKFTTTGVKFGQEDILIHVIALKTSYFNPFESCVPITT